MLYSPSCGALRAHFRVDGLVAGVSGTQVTVAAAAGPEILKMMAANGSPAPLFESDDDRLSFVIRLPSHPLAMGGITPTDQATGEVTGEVERLLRAMDGEMSRQQIQEAVAFKHEDHFRNADLKPVLTLGVMAMTLPDKPRSSNQRYRLTARGTRPPPGSPSVEFGQLQLELELVERYLDKLGQSTLRLTATVWQSPERADITLAPVTAAAQLVLAFVGFHWN